jgi:hypothetical protein
VTPSPIHENVQGRVMAPPAFKDTFSGAGQLLQ